jgi:hypothetical protein
VQRNRAVGVKTIKQQNIQRVCTTREKETERHPFLKKKSEKKNNHPPKKIKKQRKCPVNRAQGWGALLPC